MYPQDYFLEKFNSLSTADLLQIYASNDYADNAIAAALQLLTERGLSHAEIEAGQLASKQQIYRRSKGTKECDFCRSQARRSPIFDAGQRFCSQRCLRNARLLEKAVAFSQTEIYSHAHNIKHSACPICSQHNTKVEVRHAYRIWSAGVVSNWSEHTRVCCLACGRRANLKSIGFCLMRGWWGLPWGLLITPMQILANCLEMFKSRTTDMPSEELLQAARLDLAKRHWL